jgi:hypothetical protein
MRNLVLILFIFISTSAFCQGIDTSSHQTMSIKKPTMPSLTESSSTKDTIFQGTIINHNKDSGKTVTIALVSNLPLQLKGCSDSSIIINSFLLNIYGAELYSNNGRLTNDMINDLRLVAHNGKVIIRSIIYKSPDGKNKWLPALTLLVK